MLQHLRGLAIPPLNFKLLFKHLHLLLLLREGYHRRQCSIVQRAGPCLAGCISQCYNWPQLGSIRDGREVLVDGIALFLCACGIVIALLGISCLPCLRFTSHELFGMTPLALVPRAGQSIANGIPSERPMTSTALTWKLQTRSRVCKPSLLSHTEGGPDKTYSTPNCLQRDQVGVRTLWRLLKGASPLWHVEVHMNLSIW